VKLFEALIYQSLLCQLIITTYNTQHTFPRTYLPENSLSIFFFEKDIQIQRILIYNDYSIIDILIFMFY